MSSQDPLSSEITASGCAPAPRNLLRLLYNHNPFYVISASLILYGLQVSFLGGDAFQTRAMIVGLMAFVLLLACTAWLIIRLGNVWNDARTILLVIVLLFVALSVACDLSLARFDARGLRDFQSGFENFLVSYAFALIVSEGLLATLKIGLRFWYRLPYHLFLGLFFVYPLAISPLFTRSWNRLLPWGLFGFSIASAVALVTLLPAVRRGAAYTKDNGTPWRWPYFPWSLFVILAVAAGMRHYYLCLSFHTVPGVDSLFRPYFLVPPMLAVCTLFMEAALVSGRWSTRLIALTTPVASLVLAVWQPATSFWQRRFLEDFSEVTGGHPLFVSLVACVMLYALATARRLQGAVDCLTLSVAGLAVIRPTAQLADLLHPMPLPILLCGVIQLYPALIRRSSPRLLASACLMLAAFTIEYGKSWIIDEWGVVPWHLTMAIVLVVGGMFNDRFTKVLQNLGAAMLAISAMVWAAWMVTTSVETFEPPWSLWLAYLYPLIAAALAAGYGRFVGNRGYYGVAAVDIIIFSTIAAQRTYDYARQMLAGLDYLLLGALAFVIAALISLVKTGLPQRWWVQHGNLLLRRR